VTQRERVLRALKQRRDIGITQADFSLPDVIDGGKPIPRVAARIDELQKRYYINSPGTRDGFKVYVIGREREVDPAESPIRVTPEPPPAPPAPPLDQGTLHLLDDAAHRGRRSAIFDDDPQAAA
jgi:hypothetical protein